MRLVVPTNLQMGWIESPLYFCATSETTIDVAQQYFETPVDTFPNYKFVEHSAQGEKFEALPDTEN